MGTRIFFFFIPVLFNPEPEFKFLVLVMAKPELKIGFHRISEFVNFLLHPVMILVFHTSYTVLKNWNRTYNPVPVVPYPP